MTDKFKRLFTRAALAAVAVACVPAFAATGAASAAQWAELGSPSWYANASVQGTLSLQLGTYIPGLNPPVSCPVNIPLASGFVNNGGGNATLTATAHSTCQNGRSFGISLTSAASGTTALAVAAPGTTYSAPYANPTWYEQRAFTVPLVNGTGGTKSKLVFSNTLISNTMNGIRPAITATGNLEITSSTGGTYTLVP